MPPRQCLYCAGSAQSLYCSPACQRASLTEYGRHRDYYEPLPPGRAPRELCSDFGGLPLSTDTEVRRRAVYG